MALSAKSCKVALDTNMLTAMLGLKLDVFEEIKNNLGKVEFIILKQTLDELEKISKRGGKEAKKAQFALKALQTKEFNIEEVEAENCDSALLKISDKAIIATNDKALRKKIMEKGGKVIFIRQSKFIDMEA